MRSKQLNTPLVFEELIWPRPFELEQVEDTLLNLATIRPRGPVVFEIRSYGGKIRYYLGVNPTHFNKVKNQFRFNGMRFRATKPGTEPEVTQAEMLRISKPVLALNTKISGSVIRSSLASLYNIGKNDFAKLQIIIGPAYKPSRIGSHTPDPNNTWLDAILGTMREAPSQTLSQMRDKADQYSFGAVVRIGAIGTYAKAHINSLHAALETLTSAGVNIRSVSIDPSHINSHFVPFAMPLRLSVKELSIMMLPPFGEENFTGVHGVHPKETLPPEWYQAPTSPYLNRPFATSMDGQRLSITPNDSLEHTFIMGPTGSGKSTVMLNLALEDIKKGQSVLVIDPKNDFVNDILARMPEERLNDVVILDPSDPSPVGFNPIKLHPGQDPNLVAETVQSVFQEIFSENWGIRTADLLSAGLLTLVENKHANLMWLPTLFTDPEFRRICTKSVKDRITLKPFWDQFDAMKPGERAAYIEPVLNKLRQIAYRPGLRNMLGQSEPKFDIASLFYERKIVLVPLNKGIIGSESARFIGSLVVGIVWNIALTRANIPAEKRHIVSMYIDELQSYINSLPNSFEESLAIGRGLGLAIHCATQYRDQLSPSLRAGIDANCRNKIYFGLNGNDAKEIAGKTQDLVAEDFNRLPRYFVYTSFMSGGQDTGWIMGQTIPPSKPIRLPAEAKAMSQTRYGVPAETVQTELEKAITPIEKAELIELETRAFEQNNRIIGWGNTKEATHEHKS